MDDENLSRNASSSRAIPVERLIQSVIDDPVEPSFWGRNQKGMQAAEELTGDDLKAAKASWNQARADAITHARALAVLGAHKQIVNRILEPYCHIEVVVSATDWENFFALRCHPAAQPEMRVLAEAMRTAKALSVPRQLAPGEWHLPLFKPERDMNLLPGRPKGWHAPAWLPTPHHVDDAWFNLCAARIAAARCARTTYLTHDGREPVIEEDMELFGRLADAIPMHASPMEHPALPDIYWREPNRAGWDRPELHGNLRGFIQFRKTLRGESVPG